ncbi:hypothetical protein EBR21_00910 [bacterium]|nr:hypothetical protein [bacterium]
MLFRIILFSQSLVLLSCSTAQTTPSATATPTPTATATATATATPGGNNTSTNLTWNTGASVLFSTHCSCHDWTSSLSGVQGKRSTALGRIQGTLTPVMPPSPIAAWSTDKAKMINYLSSTTLQ